MMLPCHCGGAAVLTHVSDVDDFVYGVVRCSKCGYEVPNLTIDQSADVTAGMWNDSMSQEKK